MTADPSVVEGAQNIPRMQFDEAAELAYFGSRVLHPATLLPAMASMAERFSFDEIVPVSALKGDGLDALRDVVFDALPEGPHMFDHSANLCLGHL